MYNGRKYIIGLFAFVLLSIGINSTFAARDIMEVMFQPSKGYEKIIDLGSTKNAVGNEVFRSSTQYGANENLGRGCFVNDQYISDEIMASQISSASYIGSKQDFCQKVLGGDYDIVAIEGKEQAPLIVRITKFLLRMTIVLSITMILYNGILWVVESAKGGDVKDAKDNIIYIVAGILLALSSVVLINLISSITLSSLGVIEGENCIINGKAYPKGDELKKFVCENSFNGKWYDERIGNRCRVNHQTKGYDGGYWAAITNSEQASKCSELGGSFIDN